MPVAAGGRSMSFSIQTGRPAVRPCGAAADLADAVAEMYPAETEDAFLLWNLAPVRLSYAGDLAALVDNLVPLLEDVQRPDFSETEVFWGSDMFSAEWSLVRTGRSLRIRARWHSTPGNYESLLTERGDAVVRTDVFVGEWAKILRRIVTDIEATSVELDDEDIYRRAREVPAVRISGTRGRGMDPHFRNFFRAHLDLERGYEITGDLRPTLWGFNDAYVELIRTGFDQIMSDDAFGPAEYERLTDIEFPDREILHTYLRALYDHLFNNAPVQPTPPG
ncbi:hypothetical protein [Streptomyces sp. ITFR-16]|uniref:hypothetical protein n=1 Tax=Streptomyces sp. ITFR-16 TaxID=3075198 RepID=UPI00288B8C29|nr:hypothetical protein [Streptomyces sp. ITFR-16]WNI21734.1 hypothetical protein RLT58_07215 [Streptomyces sp. ITFR-16]